MAYCFSLGRSRHAAFSLSHEKDETGSPQQYFLHRIAYMLADSVLFSCCHCIISEYCFVAGVFSQPVSHCLFSQSPQVCTVQCVVVLLGFISTAGWIPKHCRLLRVSLACQIRDIIDLKSEFATLTYCFHCWHGNSGSKYPVY